ncbi:hypothetical protein HDU87_006332 [Geranomyces variabilis]|uniref:FYVE-type domain-containing protein n=1 Tax=Geranomyces variabilis TaxID=109894 RepID=A0AAD5TFL4_9FUNG|nr:hypothetical protein HDU87_006332 [Geranomyces variabilis]
MDPQTLFNRLHKRPSRPVIGSNPSNLNPANHTHYALPPPAGAPESGTHSQSLRALGTSLPSRQHFGRERTASNATLPTPVRRSHEPSIHLRRGPVIGSLKGESTGFVMGPPTRAHWKPDGEAPECDGCGETFGFLLRRHHCRRCGGVFCMSCSSHFISLDQNANFHPAGTVSRVCGTCFADYQTRGSHHVGLATPPTAPVAPAAQAANGTEAAAAAAAGVKEPSPTLPQPSPGSVSKAMPMPPGKGDKVGEAAMSLMSVPSDWQWSTF